MLDSFRCAQKYLAQSPGRLLSRSLDCGRGTSTRKTRSDEQSGGNTFEAQDGEAANAGKKTGKIEASRPP
jgi:hypothetical protein